MMVKALLTIFLVLALIGQGGSVCIQVDNDHVVTALVKDSHKIHVVNTEFDDEQRGAKFYPPASLTLPNWLKASALAPRLELQGKNFTSNRPLFKLTTALLI